MMEKLNCSGTVRPQAAISPDISQSFSPTGNSKHFSFFVFFFLKGYVFTGEVVPQTVTHTTHLVEHPVSKTQQLRKEVEPAVQEGKETQEQQHYP